MLRDGREQGARGAAGGPPLPDRHARQPLPRGPLHAVGGGRVHLQPRGQRQQQGVHCRLGRPQGPRRRPQQRQPGGRGAGGGRPLVPVRGQRQQQAARGRRRCHHPPHRAAQLSRHVCAEPERGGPLRVLDPQRHQQAPHLGARRHRPPRQDAQLVRPLGPAPRLLRALQRLRQPRGQQEAGPPRRRPPGARQAHLCLAGPRGPLPRRGRHLQPVDEVPREQGRVCAARRRPHTPAARRLPHTLPPRQRARRPGAARGRLIMVAGVGGERTPDHGSGGWRARSSHRGRLVAGPSW
mmetsp:Transcript_48662/g.121510  ORF Transcript_48662/g.121510 Transcript_48662/m.121510 type:complete len:295 (-) Transcript_48662:63-947(-)